MTSSRHSRILAAQQSELLNKEKIDAIQHHKAKIMEVVESMTEEELEKISEMLN